MDYWVINEHYFLAYNREPVANLLKALCAASGIDCYDLLGALTGNFINIYNNNNNNIMRTFSFLIFDY